MDDCGGCVDVLVLADLRIDELTSNSPRIEKSFLVRICSQNLVSGSGPRRSMSDSPPLSEIISFSKMCSEFHY